MSSLKADAFRQIIFSVVIAMASHASFAEPATQAGLVTSIEKLGTLNGLALACKEMALSTRLREILIQEVPKERENGEIFEQATQHAYLGQNGKTCPASKALATQIESAHGELLQVLGKQH